MQAALSWQHQAISVELTSQFNAYLKGKPCRVFAAPFDLCIPEYNESDEEISNIISQPDIVVSLFFKIINAMEGRKFTPKKIK